PAFLAVVILTHCRHAFRQDQPWLLRHREDVDVGREAIGIVQRTDAHEGELRTRARIVAPQRDAALRAARDVLAVATRRWRHHHYGFAVRQLDAFGFD